MAQIKNYIKSRSQTKLLPRIQDGGKFDMTVIPTIFVQITYFLFKFAIFDALTCIFL